MRAAMAEAGVTEASGPDGFGAADWIVSAVTADQSHVAAAAVAPHIRQGQIFVDINSVSPDRKRGNAATIEASGGRYLDMAVMAPVHPRGHRTPVLVAGPEAAALMPDLVALGFKAELAGDKPGAATAIKMVRSLFVKGLEAITVECLQAAEASGCRDEILASLSGSYPGLGWPDCAVYNFERIMTHGQRRAAEMEEVGATLDALGLTGDLARAVAEVQRKTARPGVPAPTAETLATAIAPVLEVRRTR
jgi:3-hydroxyisobutyrate dehydrogenase-like beta-hydroxyacid dehydrogenase